MSVLGWKFFLSCHSELVSESKHRRYFSKLQKVGSKLIITIPKRTLNGHKRTTKIQRITNIQTQPKSQPKK